MGDEEERMRALLEREFHDDVRVAALFKGFSGQRDDWQGRLDFWKALIVRLARHLAVVVIDGSQVQQRWFLRDGLLPLCLNDVLREMLRSGELQPLEEQPTPLGRRLLTWLRGAHHLDVDAAARGKLVVSALLKEKVADICKTLANRSWKSECLVTMSSFVELCGETDAAKAIMRYLVDRRLARCICIDAKDELIEGLKISLAQSSVSDTSPVDYNMLQLHWTSEKMTQRFDALDQRVSQLREAAVTAKDKRAALRNLRSMKVLATSRDKCADFLSRINEILDAIADAEATQKVSEAIRLGNMAMKQHHITLEEVHEQLKEMDDAMALARLAGDALAGSASLEDDEVLQEFASLEAEVSREGQEAELEKPPASRDEEKKRAPSGEDDERIATVVQGVSKLKVAQS